MKRVYIFYSCENNKCRNRFLRITAKDTNEYQPKHYLCKCGHGEMYPDELMESQIRYDKENENGKDQT